MLDFISNAFISFDLNDCAHDERLHLKKNFHDMNITFAQVQPVELEKVLSKDAYMLLYSR